MRNYRLFDKDDDIMQKVLSNNKKYQGSHHKKVDRYLGIRYAHAPIGRLRFKFPERVDLHDSGTVIADTYPANPIQKGKLEKSEDCLFLNIWKPSEIKDDIPIIVWIYGGSFESGGIGKKGTGIGLTYDAQKLCEDTQCIIITINYRLNVFGFLDFTSFSDKFDSNIGIKDIVCGLEWIKENIYEFGGNSDNVTLFGQSAGAMLIACLNKIPSAQHLYHKMIIESACIESLYTQQEATAISQKYLDLLGVSVDHVDDLLDFSTDRLLAVNHKLEEFVREKILGITTFAPVIDGQFLTESVYKGSFFTKKPMMIGSTQNEARLFTRFTPHVSEETGKKFFPYMTQQEYQHIIYHYPNFPNFLENSKLLTDIMYTVPKYWLADNYSIENPVYVYRFDFYSGIFKLLNLKACHIIDVPIQFDIGMYLYFGNILKAKRLGHYMRQYIGNFAKTGNPNGKTLFWKQYSVRNPNVLIVDSKLTLESDPDKKTKLIYKDVHRFFHNDNNHSLF